MYCIILVLILIISILLYFLSEWISVRTCFRGGLMLPFTHGNTIGSCLVSSTIQSICNSLYLAESCVTASMGFDSRTVPLHRSSEPLIIKIGYATELWIKHVLDRIPNINMGTPVLTVLIGRYIEFNMIAPRTDPIYSKYYDLHDGTSTDLLSIAHIYALALSHNDNSEYVNNIKQFLDSRKATIVGINILQFMGDSFVFLDKLQQMSFSLNDYFIRKLTLENLYNDYEEIYEYKTMRQLCNVAFHVSDNEYYIPTDIIVNMKDLNNEVILTHVCYYNLFSNIIENNADYYYLPIEELFAGITKDDTLFKNIKDGGKMNISFKWSSNSCSVISPDTIHFQKFYGISKTDVEEANYYIIDIGKDDIMVQLRNAPWMFDIASSGEYKNMKRKLYLKLLSLQTGSLLAERYKKNFDQVLANKGRYVAEYKTFIPNKITYTCLPKYDTNIDGLHRYRIERETGIIHEIREEYDGKYIDMYNGKYVLLNEVPPLNFYPPFIIDPNGNMIYVDVPWRKPEGFENIEHWIAHGNTLNYDPTSKIPVTITATDNIWETINGATF